MVKRAHCRPWNFYCAQD